MTKQAKRKGYADPGFMRLLIDAGFGVGIAQASDAVVIESPTSYRNSGQGNHVATAGKKYIDPNSEPPMRVQMPKTVKIRFKPNQNVTTPRFEPTIKPYGYPVKNALPTFDTLAEHRDFLNDRYLEAIERVKEQRQAKIDKRMEKHQELLDKMDEVAPTWRRLQALDDPDLARELQLEEQEREEEEREAEDDEDDEDDEEDEE